MLPIKFPEANTYATSEADNVQPLPCHVSGDHQQVISCWKLSKEELELIQETGVVYLSVLTYGTPLQPFFMTADKNDLFDYPDAQQ